MAPPRDTPKGHPQGRSLGSRFPSPTPNGAPILALLPSAGGRTHTDTLPVHMQQKLTVPMLRFPHHLCGVCLTLTHHCLWVSRKVQVRWSGTAGIGPHCTGGKYPHQGCSHQGKGVASLVQQAFRNFPRSWSKGRTNPGDRSIF